MCARHYSAQKYSSRLGIISDEQFQAALDRFDLGTFIRAEPIPYGLSKRNVFLTTTKGSFVFRGSPHSEYQFLAERFYARQLHEHTQVPVPWPYLVDRSSDIFGWSYVIMPRMPGLQLADRALTSTLSLNDRRGIARAMGANLALMQDYPWRFAGQYHGEIDDILPFDSSYADWITGHIRNLLVRSCEHSDRTTEEDCRWVEEYLAAPRDALNEPFQPCFVMQDYKESNVVATFDGGEWHISGVFDFTQAHVGDGEADLARTLAQYLDTDPMLASEFLRTYVAHKPPRPGFEKRFPVYMLHERLQTWEFCQQVGHPRWNASLTLREWVQPYISSLSMLHLCQPSEPSSKLYPDSAGSSLTAS